MDNNERKARRVKLLTELNIPLAKATLIEDIGSFVCDAVQEKMVELVSTRSNMAGLDGYEENVCLHVALKMTSATLAEAVRLELEQAGELVGAYAKSHGMATDEVVTMFLNEEG